MPQENVEARTNAKEGASRAGVLIRYRVVGGPVSVDQRLTVFENGAVALDERHRSRDPIWLRLDVAELDRVRTALEEIPERRWSKLPKLALIRVKKVIMMFIPFFEDHAVSPPTYFELKRGRRAIAGEKPTYSVKVVVRLLDPLRVRAVRAEPR